MARNSSLPQDCFFGLLVDVPATTSLTRRTPAFLTLQGFNASVSLPVTLFAEYLRTDWTSPVYEKGEIRRRCWLASTSLDRPLRGKLPPRWHVMRRESPSSQIPFPSVTGFSQSVRVQPRLWVILVPAFLACLQGE